MDLKQGDRVQWTDGSIREIEGVTHDPNRHTVRLHFTSGRSFTLHEETEIPRIEMQQPEQETGQPGLRSTLPQSGQAGRHGPYTAREAPGGWYIYDNRGRAAAGPYSNQEEAEAAAKRVTGSKEKLTKVTGRLAKFGKSKATVKVSPGHEQNIDSYLGKQGMHKELASMVGAPDSATVTASLTYEGVYIEVNAPEYTATREIKRNPNTGELHCHNSTFFMRHGYGRQGLGAQVFASQVANCIEQGLAYIDCWAARSSSMNGYYTWPRLGYDAPLSDVKVQISPSKWTELQQRFPNAQSILDIMETKDGRDWWKTNGRDLHNAKFDLAEGSRSRRVLEAYLAAREAQGAQA
jgi:hypothetical protein